MDTLVAMIILAVVQGVTEFLPISSSAHLVLLSELFGGSVSRPAVDIVLHAATLIAVVFYFKKDIYRLIRALCSRVPSKDRSIVYALLLGTLPIVVAGFFMYPVFSSVRSIPIVAVALIVSGSLLILADRSMRKGNMNTDIPLWRKGIGIGLLQVFALLPGVSRSGITVAGGRLFGFSRREAARFSFLLAVPTIIGALVLLLARLPADAALFADIEIGPLLLAAGIAGGVAYATIHFFLTTVERIGFVPFFGYQVVLGTALLLLSAI